MGADNRITLFVMQGCQLCPQMVRLFEEIFRSGKIQSLDVFDISEHPELAKKHHIRSAPHYLINGVGFTGLRTAGEIDKLLLQGQRDNWAENIAGELSGGNLKVAEGLIRENDGARRAMTLLLKNPDTELVVRIGLSALIESLADTDVLHELEADFVDLAGSSDERIAMDALYYLQLIATPACISKLHEVDRSGNGALAKEARELLAELSAPVQ